MTIAVVTDSTCDIPNDLADRLSIHIVPNIVIIDGKSYEDGKDISRQEFYERLLYTKSLPTTAAASAGKFLELYTQLLQGKASQIISIHASSKLSGIFNSASLAAQDFSERVKVVDGQQVSLALGFQVLVAAEAAIEGKSIQAILEQIENVQRRVRLIAMLDTLEYVRRSGRVSWARASLGSLLRIKPVIEVKDGVVHRLGEVRTRTRGLSRLLEIIKNMEPFERLTILHTNAESEAHQLLESLELPLSTEPLMVNATTVIGVHTGPKALGFAGVVKS